MKRSIISTDASIIPRYATLPMVFASNRVYEWQSTGQGLIGLSFQERTLAHTFRKDYDAGDNGPLSWPQGFDLQNWGFLVIAQGDDLIAGATIAHDTPGVQMLNDDPHLAVLWDIRVQPHYQGQGLGRQLFTAAEDWSRARGCHKLSVETQNNNVAACQFYANMGCEIESLRRFAYAEFPDEIQILWCKFL